MTTDEKHDATDKTTDERRSYLRYLLETAWAYGTGVMAAYWLA